MALLTLGKKLPGWKPPSNWPVVVVIDLATFEA